MFVIKRNGEQKPVLFDKISTRINKLCNKLRQINPIAIAQDVIKQLKNNMHTSELDILAAEHCASLSSLHPDYGTLAGRIFVSNLHKNTEQYSQFSILSTHLYQYIHPQTQKAAPLLSEAVYLFIQENKEVLDAAIKSERDYDLDYFGVKTLAHSYLLKLNDVVAERPCHLFMRVACGIHYGDLPSVLELYELLSLKMVIFGSPTLFASGSPRPQLSSCFLSQIKEDSIEGIYETLKDSACISKYAGGQSISVHDIRASGSYISGTNGFSDGLLPMLRVFNQSAKYVNQSNRRPGAIAIYLELSHPDIESFLELRKGNGTEDTRCRSLFTALWISELFLERVHKNELWSLMCPSNAKGLSEVWGEEYNKLYTKYESMPYLVRKRIPARQLFDLIRSSLQETGTPYLLNKDQSNKKSNQQNRGTIKAMNLCVEIVQYSSPEETAVCNLGSIALSRFVLNKEQPLQHGFLFDFQQLYTVTKIMTRALNRVIDIGFLPTKEARLSQRLMRAIGMGVQGYYDALVMMRIPYNSERANEWNTLLFETMYYAACEQSYELSVKDGPYETFQGSPMSEGKFQFDLWEHTPTSGRYDWQSLREKIMAKGMRNSLLLSLLPTATTSQILGNYESFEAPEELICIRRVLSGEFVVISKYLMHDLLELGIWNTELKNKIIANGGSIQGLDEIPLELQQLHLTAWEISERVMTDQAVARGPFICQSSSQNVHLENIDDLWSLVYDRWKRGLKTILYYLRSKKPVGANSITIEPTLLEEIQSKKRKRETKQHQISKEILRDENNEEQVCKRGCTSCGA